MSDQPIIHGNNQIMAVFHNATGDIGIERSATAEALKTMAWR